MNAVPVIFDCDTGIDDSIALLYLLGHPRCELTAVLSTAGNVPVDAVCAANLGWLELLGREDIPVCRGAGIPLATPLRTAEDTHGPVGVGYAELPTPTRADSGSAVDAWIELTASRPGEVVGLLTGPATTLATAIRSDPTLPQRLRRLVIMGGAFGHPGNTSPVGEWNVMVDPEALAEVLAAFSAEGAPAPLICPLDITESVVLTSDHLGRLAAASNSEPVEQPLASDARGSRSVTSNPVVRTIIDAVRFYFEFHEDQDEGYLAHLHDPFAAAVALDPTRVRTYPATVDVELTGTLTRGATVADTRGHWGRKHNAHIVVDADVDAFFEELIETVAAVARTVPNTPITRAAPTDTGDDTLPDGVDRPDEP